MSGSKFVYVTYIRTTPENLWHALTHEYAMNIRHALVLAVSIGLFLISCTTPRDEARLERLMQHPSWPRIQQAAETEVKKREKILGWPGTAAYLPLEHTKRVWTVTAMSGTASGGVGRVVILTIDDNGDVLAYQRGSEGLR